MYLLWLYLLWLYLYMPIYFFMAPSWARRRSRTLTVATLCVLWLDAAIIIMCLAGRGVRAGGGAAWPRGGGARPVAAAIRGTDRQAAASKYSATPGV